MIDEIDEIEDSILDEFEDECLDALDILYNLRHTVHADKLQFVYWCMMRMLHKTFPDNYVPPTLDQIRAEWNR